MAFDLNGDYAKALDYFQKSLAINEAIGDRQGVANSLNSIGIVKRHQRDYPQALDYLRKSLAIKEELGDRAGIAVMLYNIGRVYYRQGDYAGAADFTARSAAIARPVGANEILWENLTLAGAAYRRLNKPPEARQSLEEAITVIEALRAQVAGGEEEQQRSFEAKVSPYYAMSELLVAQGKPFEALTYAERARSRALLDAIRTVRGETARSLTAEEREDERRLQAQLISLNTQVTRAGQQEKPDRAMLGELKTLRDKARLDYEAFQTSLYAAHPELRAERGEAPVIDAAELAPLLPDERSALLEYVVTDDAAYLFAITRASSEAAASVQVHTLPIKREDLSGQIENFRRQLSGRDLGFRASARNLYQLLLKPAQAQLTGKTSVVIVPDDKLWELPFQALIDDGGRYLIEHSAVSYAPSLTALREMKSQREKRGSVAATSSLLALGNPSLGRETIERATLALRDSKLDPLPDAETEVKALGRLYGAARSRIYVGADAREDHAKAEAGQSRVLHFATHGVLNNASPM
jgi:CHAT domain-containing protein